MEGPKNGYAMHQAMNVKSRKIIKHEKKYSKYYGNTASRDKVSARGSIRVCPCKSLYKNVEIVIWLTNAAVVEDMTTLLTKMILKSATLEVLSQTFLSKIFFMAAFAESLSAIHNQTRANTKADRRYPTKMRF